MSPNQNREAKINRIISQSGHDELLKTNIQHTQHEILEDFWDVTESDHIRELRRIFFGQIFEYFVKRFLTNVFDDQFFE